MGVAFGASERLRQIKVWSRSPAVADIAMANVGELPAFPAGRSKA